MRWTTDEVRRSFLEFFGKRGHRIVSSAALIPKGDPTLLFTNAGMVQFKDYFLGVRTPSSPRIVDCQKCLRISGKHNDLEAVGRDSYHHTFFEMLGNWSFGDYYKREAIEWHWELITKVWEIPSELLWATVHKDDDEAHRIWCKLKVLPEERILKFGDKDNFWEMGETGPCGPNSEIHIDRGARACDGHGHPGRRCGVNVDGCERFVELGNLVFIQCNRDASRKLTPLAKKHVDTGSGLERIAAMLQTLEQRKAGKLAEDQALGNYDIDVFTKIIASIANATSLTPGERTSGGRIGGHVRYGDSPDTDVSFRAIADHARAITFLMAEGLAPGNTEREYVLRRIVRRAARHGRHLDIEKPFLTGVCAAVQEAMGLAYPELQKLDPRPLLAEEERFGETLDRGLDLLHAERKEMERRSEKVFPGDIAFKLYDTYGFPLDLTQDILRDHGIEVDVAGFDRLMEQQRERARSARKEGAVAPELKLGAGVASRFVGYRSHQAESEVLASHGGSGESLTIVAAETPFYPEGGGQVGDRGVIESESGAILEVLDTRKSDGSIAHIGRLLKGETADFQTGARVTLRVDRARREAAMLNHSATHILHYALRDVLGASVHQAGSLVAPDRLRFDFSFTGAVPEGELQTIEEEINARIREDAEVASEEMAYDDAIKAGALAFFGDKYGDRVRVIRMGDFSIELCGGTHVSRTGEIGFFKLEGESGVAAGVRRVEALTGQGALETIRRREKVLEQMGAHLGARDAVALERLERLLAREKELEKKIRALEQKLVSGDQAAGGGEIREIKGVKVVTRRVSGIEAAALREMADTLRSRHPSAVIVIGSDLGDKATLLVAVTPDLTSRFRAGDIIKQIAPIIGGSGGGRAEMAQAGGKDPSKLGEALERVFEIVG